MISTSVCILCRFCDIQFFHKSSRNLLHPLAPSCGSLLRSRTIEADDLLGGNDDASATTTVSIFKKETLIDALVHIQQEFRQVSPNRFLSQSTPKLNYNTCSVYFCSVLTQGLRTSSVTTTTRLKFIRLQYKYFRANISISIESYALLIRLMAS